MRFSGDVERLTVEAEGLGYARPRARLYALTRRTFETAETGTAGFVIMGVIGLAVGAVALWGALALARLLLFWLPPGATDAVLYIGCGLALLVAGIVRWSASLNSGFKLGSEPADKLQAGRINDLLIAHGAAGFYAFAIGLLVGGQAALLQLSSGHLGLDAGGTIWGALVLTLDNVLHGVFLDAFELYGIALVPVEHTVWSATVFLVFRTLVTALVVLIGYSFFQARTYGRVCADLSDRVDCPADLVDWLHGLHLLVGERNHLRYHAEVMFLVMLGDFIAGDDDGARAIGRRLVGTTVGPELRELLVDATGQPILPDDQSP